MPKRSTAVSVSVDEQADLFPADSALTISNLPCSTVAEAEVLAGAISKWAEKQNRSKWNHAAGWFRNMAFFTGNHVSHFSYRPGSTVDSSGQFSITPVSGMYKKYAQYINRQVDNKCKKAYETPVGILTKANPRPRVTPNSGSPTDKRSANLAEIAFTVLWDSPLNMSSKLRTVAGMLVLFGTSFVEIEYRETNIPLQIPRVRAEEYDDPEQEELLDGEKPVRLVSDGFDVIYRKAMCADVWSPFHITPDPAATEDPDSMQWIMRMSFQDVGQLKEEIMSRAEGDLDEDEKYFTENLEYVNAAKMKHDNCLYWYQEIKDLIDNPESLQPYSSFSHTNSEIQLMNETIKTVVDVRPNKKFPMGRTIVLGGDKILYCGPARAWSEKYPERWHPYTCFRFWKTVNRFWGASLFSDVVPLQMRINKIDTLMKINQMFMTFGVYRVPRGSLSEQDNMSHIPGIRLEYLPVGGQGPEKLRNDPLPSEIMVERQMMERAIDELSMVSRLLETNNVSHLRSGAIIEMLQKEVVDSKSAVIMDFQDAIKHVAQNILIELNLNLEDEDPELTQKMRAAAEDYSSLIVSNFTSADLHDNINIEIDIISAILTSPEAEAQKALDYVQVMQGQITPHERSKVLEKLGLDEFDNPENIEIERADFMIENIVNGDLNNAVPDPFLDNPAIFAERFKNALRKPKSYEYPPEVAQRLTQLAEFYDQLNQQAMQSQYEQQLALIQAKLDSQ